MSPAQPITRYNAAIPMPMIPKILPTCVIFEVSPAFLQLFDIARPTIDIGKQTTAQKIAINIPKMGSISLYNKTTQKYIAESAKPSIESAMATIFFAMCGFFC